MSFVEQSDLTAISKKKNCVKNKIIYVGCGYAGESALLSLLNNPQVFGKLQSIEEKTLCIFAKDGILLIDEYSIKKSVEYLLVPQKTISKKYAT